jgi:hypothetical protein
MLHDQNDHFEKQQKIRATYLHYKSITTFLKELKKWENGSGKNTKGAHKSMEFITNANLR